MYVYVQRVYVKRVYTQLELPFLSDQVRTVDDVIDVMTIGDCSHMCLDMYVCI